MATKNPTFYKLRKQISAQNPDLSDKELEAETIRKYNEAHPDDPITVEGEKTNADGQQGIVEENKEPGTSAETAENTNPTAADIPTHDDETITISKSELNTMLQELVNKAKSDIAKELQQSINTNPEPKEQSENDDYLDTPVIFFAYVHQYLLNSYKRRGQIVMPPHGTIKFAHSAKYRKSVMGSNEYRDVQLCTAIIRSKAEAEYIRQCPDYGVRVFENINGGDNINSQIADYLSKARMVVSTMSSHAVITRAGELGVPVTEDIDAVRRNIMYKMAEEEMKVVMQVTRKNAAADVAINDNVASSAIQAKQI